MYVVISIFSCLILSQKNGTEQMDILSLFAADNLHTLSLTFLRRLKPSVNLKCFCTKQSALFQADAEFTPSTKFTEVNPTATLMDHILSHHPVMSWVCCVCVSFFFSNLAYSSPPLNGGVEQCTPDTFSKLGVIRAEGFKEMFDNHLALEHHPK